MSAIRLNVIAVGLVIGAGLGLLYGLAISPLQYTNTSPADLRSDYQEQYVIMTAASFHANGDLRRAQDRLAALNLADAAESVTALAQRAAAQQRDENVVAWLGELAFALGVAPEPVTSSPEIVVAPTTPPPPATEPPAATATPEATPVPSPTATPVYDFLILSQEEVCDPALDEPLLQVEIINELGEPQPGVPVLVRWPTGEDRFYTGLKPDINPGYGDFTMTEGEVYALQVGSRTPPVPDLRIPVCEDEIGGEYPGSVRIQIQRGD